MKKLLLIVCGCAVLGTTGCIVFPEHHHRDVIVGPAPVVVVPGHDHDDHDHDHDHDH